MDLFGTLVLPPDPLRLACLVAGRGFSAKAVAMATSGFPAALLVEEMGLNPEQYAIEWLTGSYPNAQCFIDFLRTTHVEAGVGRPGTLSLVDDLTALALELTVLAPQCSALLEQWRRAGLQLQLVSDVSLQFSCIIGRLGLTKWFSDPILSCTSGRLKRGGAAFTQLNPHLKWTVIGDSWRSDVLGGLAADHDVIFVDASSDHFVRDLFRDVRALLELAEDGHRIRIVAAFREALFDALPLSLWKIEHNLEEELLLRGDGTIGFRFLERVRVIEQIGDLCHS